MGLLPCPDCGNQCSLLAIACPKCGRPLKLDSIAKPTVSPPRQTTVQTAHVTAAKAPTGIEAANTERRVLLIFALSFLVVVTIVWLGRKDPASNSQPSTYSTGDNVGGNSNYQPTSDKATTATGKAYEDGLLSPSEKKAYEEGRSTDPDCARRRIAELQRRTALERQGIDTGNSNPLDMPCR